jgi:transcription-repair coupling factor (superfamily II helicase)
LPVENIDKLYKYSSKEGMKPTIYRLNSNEWKKTKQKIKAKIKDISDELLRIYRKRQSAKVIPFEKDNEVQKIFESEFIYDETPDQLKVTREIKNDLESDKPMDRLLCGDVGYGKTEVIFRTIFKTVMNNKQVMYLCPTTILSYQQYLSALDRFKSFAVNMELLNRNRTKKEADEVIEKLKSGKVDVIFGTHRLLSNDVEFNNLGLLIIDEEHRFGVEHKEKIKKFKENVHVLSVSATPIPRSLQMSLVGIRDLSLIDTPPKKRYPVQTYVIEYNELLLREAVIKEISRDGQVFILYNKIDDIDSLCQKYSNLIPEAKIRYAHGRIDKEEIQQTLIDFMNNEFNVLISTTIIENGIDIPNANTMIIIDADRFGLSQLYQIRGRVGRSDRIAYAYLMYNKFRVLTETALKRLDAIKEFTELGSGYKISMRDLSIRGSGDILGKEQAGFIDSVGMELYLELVNESVHNIEDEAEDKAAPITDVSTHIDDNYSSDDEIIIDLHKKIKAITNLEELQLLKNEITDRFGKIDETLEVYMYETLLEKIMEKTNIKIFENTNKMISIRLDDEVINKINVEKLFLQSTKINSKFKFEYKNKFLLISLTKTTLEKSYIFYMYELLSNIEKEISSI